MNLTPALNELSRQVRLLALLIIAALVGATVVAVGDRAGRGSTAPTVRLLGAHRLLLDAFNGSNQEFLRVSPITSKPKSNHSTDIALTGISLNVDAPAGENSGAGAGKVAISSFNCTKALDKVTPALLSRAFTAGKFAVADVYVVPAGSKGTPAEELDFSLTNATVISDHETAKPSGTTESISFPFTKIEVKYLVNGVVKSTATLGASSGPPTG
jgi:type VI protein secretion system component Hcp